MHNKYKLSWGSLVVGILVLFDLILLVHIVKQKSLTVDSSKRSVQLPDTLVISRAADTVDNLPPLKRTITHRVEIIRLYQEMSAHPTLPETVFAINGERITFHTTCPVDFFARYTLTFYKDGHTILHALYDPTGCRTIQIGNNKDNIREAFSSNFSKNFQNILSLSNRDFYGYQNGRLN